MLSVIFFMVVCIFTSVNGLNGVVKHHSDGSISSNSGPTPSLERLLGMVRRTRASFMIESKLKSPESRLLSDKQMVKIVEEHNKYRRTISATNMEKLNWDPNLAAAAQAHANHCTLEHTVDRGNTGENIWVSQQPDFSLAVRLWYEEVYDAKCGCKDTFKECCGHYTQLIWAETNKIGCGFAKCQSIVGAPGHHYSLVCQYSPAGNLVTITSSGEFLGLPAFKATSGKNVQCSECPNDTVCLNGLCDRLR